MRKLSLILVCLIAAVIGAASAAFVVQYYYPNVGSIGALTVYINDVEYADETPINWGACQPGYMYWKNMTVMNMGNVALNVSIVLEGLESSWTLTWDANNTELQVGESVMGWLNLTIPTEATTWGTWGFYLNGEEPTA